MRSSSSFRWNCGCVSIERGAARSRDRARAGRARPIPRRGIASVEPGEHDHARCGSPATQRSSRATAGAESVIPAAQTNPAGGAVRQRSPSRVEQPRAPLRRVDRARAARARPASDRARSRTVASARSQCSDSSAASSRSRSRAGATSSTSNWSSVRASSPASRTASAAVDRLARPRALLADQPREDHPPRERRDRGRQRPSASPGRAPRPPPRPVGVADRHQPRQQQPAAARAHERVGHRAHARDCWGAGPARAPAAADRRRSPHQPGDQRVGERPVRGDRVERWAARSAIGQDRLGLRRSAAACRRRTTAPDGRCRRRAPPRSRGPRTDWSRTVPRASRAIRRGDRIWTPV